MAAGSSMLAEVQQPEYRSRSSLSSKAAEISRRDPHFCFGPLVCWPSTNAELVAASASLAASPESS